MKPQPLFVGEENQTHEEVVRSYVASLDDCDGYRPGECWGKWYLRDDEDDRWLVVWVTLVSVGPADWRFAVFEDGPSFRI